MKKILLAGYMGVGKSTIGAKLAETLHWNYIDLDLLIEQTQGLTVATIFETKGEIYFRKEEHRLLKACLDNDEYTVISLGGGTPCYANNHRFFETEGVQSIYLKATIATLIERIKKSGTNRPLLNTIDDLPAFIGQHLFERSYYYNQAQHRITVDGVTVDEIVQTILSKLALT